MDYSDFTPEELVAAVKAAIQDRKNTLRRIEEAQRTLASIDESMDEMGREVVKRCKGESDER